MLYIRVDANEIIATGHVMRCLSIAQAAKRMGEETTFIVADKTGEALIKKNGFPVICLHSKWDDLIDEKEQLADVIHQLHIDLLLIDSYYVTEDYLAMLNKLTQTAYIDDLNRFAYPVDILINYNFYAENLKYKERYRKLNISTEFLLGPKYAPLREEFIVEKKNITECPTKILITSGGTDNFNMNMALLEEFQKHIWFEKLEYYVILGAFNPYREALEQKWGLYPNIHLLSNVKNMSYYMQECDMAVTAGGTTVYELCACGIPSVLYTMADNQYMIAQTVSDRKWIPWVGDIRNDKDSCVRKIAEQIETDIKDYTGRKQKSISMQETVDGCGSERIVSCCKNFLKRK